MSLALPAMLSVLTVKLLMVSPSGGPEPPDRTTRRSLRP